MELQFEHIPRIKIFVSSPGDINPERKIVEKVIKELRNEDEAFYGKATIEPILWEKMVLESWTHPQKAIDMGLAIPSKCNIVLVMFWSRMGTPLPKTKDFVKDDGSQYLSGTEWEYEDAIRGAKSTGDPKVYLYRKTKKPDLYSEDKRIQFERVEEFFSRFTAPDGSISGSYYSFEETEAFEEMIKRHLKGVIKQLLEEPNLLDDLRQDDFEERFIANSYSPLRVNSFIMDRANQDNLRERALYLAIKQSYITPEVLNRVVADSGKSLRIKLGEYAEEFKLALTEEHMASLLQDDLDVSKQAVDTAKTLVTEGVFSTSIYRHISRHKKWEVRRNSVNIVIELDDKDSFDTLLNFRSYHKPLYFHMKVNIAKYFRLRNEQEQLNDIQRCEALELLNHYLNDGGDLAAKKQGIILEAITVLENSLTKECDDIT